MDANQNIEAQQNIVRELVAGKMSLPDFIHRTQPQKQNGRKNHQISFASKS
ncbi:MAG: hypothetical protein JWM16_1137, partial [Verrucomicrobiales bacterium]|nr:hypothetical protein [Verrucomicrobiales bacterium]